MSSKLFYFMYVMTSFVFFLVLRFDDNTVGTTITSIFQAHWRKPWLNYEEVDEGTRTHWWNQFTKHFLWNADVDALVKKEYDKKAHKRLKEITYNVTVRNKSIPKWMGKLMFQQLMVKRKAAKFLERSERAKKKRRGGSLSNLIEPSHFQGSISASKHAKKMAQKAGGVLPTPPRCS
ncbi:uncharacterized protein LOC110730671 [Chenopodium quinoa]|uniref:uncharacterized protein LOC110730671 n=1 Tax=Chenopodium quinoa TaxID=63459 RepID=UPI000B770976|nr:uncharacterized protein LOC110730671 [Chenopodium quinoa]XP_021766192.1 uncharacterized protein LOC110730671 [Chenopodium quinoa]